MVEVFLRMTTTIIFYKPLQINYNFFAFIINYNLSLAITLVHIWF